MSKEHAYAYEAGYRDGSIHYELEHCPACKNVADLQEALEENAKLQDENARLRSCLSDDAENARMIMAENAKMHEELEQWHRLTAGIELPEYPITEFKPKDLERENAKLRELVRGLHMAYIGALNECAGMEAGLIWEYCDMVDTELAKSHARFEAARHRFDVTMSELGIEVDE